MAARSKSVPSKSTKRNRAIGKKSVTTAKAAKPDLTTALALLKKFSSQRDRDNLGRFGIMDSKTGAKKAIGVSMSNIQKVAKQLGRDHGLAEALWKSGWYEARMLAAFVEEPDRITPAQMDRWCRDFDNWGICDTLCFCLFDRTRHAWPKVAQWAVRREEFVKRAAFALLWGLSVHDKTSGDERFVQALSQIEKGAADERHFVKKSVNMALRAIGKRNPQLHAAAIAVAKRLAASSDPRRRWIGSDALRELSGPSVARRLATKLRATKA